MGQKHLRSKDSLIIDRMLLESFKDTDLIFPFEEIRKIKIRFKNAEKYFGKNFDYLIFFNNFIFKEGIAILYDNYINKIEEFTKNIEEFNKKNKKQKKEKIFYLFVDFDDEYDDITDYDFDTLYTVIFEKLEISNITCFSFMNCNEIYINIFLNQLYESVYFYRSNRYFDCLYFLFPNGDSFVKNENYVIYFGNLIDNQRNNKYYISTFNSFYFKDFLNIKYSHSNSNDKIILFISNLKYISFIKYVINLNLNYNDLLLFLSDYENINNIHKLLTNKSKKIQIYCFLEPILYININQNFINFIKNIITNIENSIFENTIHEIKIINMICKLKIEVKKKENNKEYYIDNKLFKSRNVFKSPNALSEIEEVTETINTINTITTKISLNEKYNLIQIDKLIQMLINISFAKNKNKKRELTIEYIEIKSIQKPSKNNLIQNNILKIKKEKNNFNISNNFDDEGVENENSKNKTLFNYSIETINYKWFVEFEECNKIKITIIFCIVRELSKFNLFKNDKIDIKFVFQILFDFIFYKKNKYFYCNMNIKRDLNITQKEFENNLYE